MGAEAIAGLPKAGTAGRSGGVMAESFPMTPKGAKKLKEELQRLKEERPKISKDIETAREHGDLKENAEYHAAKERQGMVEAQIKDIEAKLALSEIIDPAKLTGDRIRFGATVTLSNVDTDEELRYQIVGADEADIDAGTISISAPLARALIGKEPGDEVRVTMPAGQRIFEVVEVEYI